MMGEWKEYKLGDVVDVINGYAFKSSNFIDSPETDALPVIKIKNVANGDVHLNDVQYHAYDSSLKKFVIEKGDILIALTGNHPEVMTQVVGEASLYKLNEKALLNQRVAKILPKEGLNKNYLYYFLKNDSTHHALASNSAGSANQANISKTDIENLSLFLPSYKEQVSIGYILASLDNKIDLLQRQNKTLEQLAETLFRQWFVEEDNDFEEKPLDKIAEFLNGLACQKYSVKSNEIGLPVIKIRELHTGITDNSDIATNDIPAKYLVEDGDMLFSWSGSLDVVLWSGGNGVLNQHLFKVTSPEFPQWFYYLWVKQYLPEFQAIAENKATTMGHIQRHHLSSAMVLVPPKNKLKEMDETMSPLFQKIKTNSQQIKTLIKLRNALLPKLMSGEVRVEI